MTLRRPLEIGVRHHRIHELSCDALSAMLREHEDITEPCECRFIGHHACERDLRRAAIGVAVER